MSDPDGSGGDAGSTPVVTDRPDPQSAEGRKVLHRAIAASAMGNATEWFDYGVYAAVATYITSHFFPGDLGTLGTMLALAVSFVLRPVGGLVWGPLGDRLGRKSVLALTIVLMSVATAAIGILPTHQQVGVLAPILLIALRVVQGFSTGGEYGGAATFMAEYAPDDKRGHYGSFLEFGTLAGFAGGTAFVLLLRTLLGEEAMADWGWRLPFFVALPLGLVGLYLRSRLDESPVFEESQSSREQDTTWAGELKDLFTRYWPQILTMGGMVVALNVVNYTLLTYQQTYLEKTVGIEASHANMILLIGQVVMMFMLPAFGSLSDRVGRKPMWLFSLLGLFVMAIPMYLLMAQGFIWAIVGFTVLGALYIPQLSTISATFPAMFPTSVRFAGFAISYNIATAAFGGTAPLVSEWGIESTGWDVFPAAYMMVGCLVGLIALFFYRETAGCSLRGDGIPGVPSAFERHEEG